MRTRLFAELYRRNPLLTFVAWLHIVALLAALVGYWSDDRLVLGINTWIKPMKFTFSLAVYLWTIAWLSRYIRRPRWAFKTVSVVIAAVVLIETSCILIQAGRGTTSHFNTATDFDAVIFQTMGIMIGIDMLMTVIILLMFKKPGMRLQPAYLWGIRSGLILFLVGGVISAVMFVNDGHSVGAPDWGPGLPFLNWSTVGGDLRVSHGLALHALQILPLTGFAISRWSQVTAKAAKLAVLAVAVCLYSLLVYATFRQAMAGEPFIQGAAARVRQLPGLTPDESNSGPPVRYIFSATASTSRQTRSRFSPRIFRMSCSL